MAFRWIHPFAVGAPTDRAPLPADPALLGQKGAGLAEMAALDLPVPPGFIVSSRACAAFLAGGERFPDGLERELDEGIALLEAATGRKLGGADPLLLSVRAGAVDAIPGMLATVLNVGLDTRVAEALAGQGDPKWAWGTWARFVPAFGDIVLGIHYTRFSRAADAVLAGRPPEALEPEELAALARAQLAAAEGMGEPFPALPREQLQRALAAAFRSFNSHRARYYRKTLGLAEDAGAAVVVQVMVYGDRAPDSGSGTCHTRDPATGAAGLVGRWYPGHQGDHTGIEPRGLRDLGDALPATQEALRAAAARLETHYGDAQEIEFTVDAGTLWLLQTRSAPRTTHAAVQVVVDLVAEGRITEREALARIDPRSLESLLRPLIHPDATKKVIARGLDASPGAACGRVVFEASDCQAFFERDEPTVLVRLDTTPEDVQGLVVAAGVLTARGGQTSHAAVVARGMGKPCVVGCTEIQVDYARELFYAGDTVVRKGEWITIDGGTGEVMQGQVEMLAPRSDDGAMSTLLAWADRHARLKVRANADTGPDAARARSLGAVGIGLCRTEHMFFQPDALRAIRRMILADDPRSRQRALHDILPIQKAMFREVFLAMAGLPVTVRLLDPPLHEFLPEREQDLSEVATDLGVRASSLQARLEQLREANPMMGHRGVRVGITSPEVYRTQVRALFEAACELVREGVAVLPEVLVPLVGISQELQMVRELVVEVAEQVIAEHGVGPNYRIGVMIELPRACLTAGELANHCDFFSFGTNDLTQMVYGFSRDDMGKFFPDYQREGVLVDSPLAVFDVEGVGELVRMAVERGRATRALLPIGVCGEHGGEPVGVRFFHGIGVDYVSCSPYRVPVARLAAAHAALGITR